MNVFGAWIEVIKIALSSGKGALIRAGLFAVSYTFLSYFLLGVSPATVPLFIVLVLGLILGEGINQLMNNPKRQYLAKQQLVIKKLETLDAGVKAGYLSPSEKQQIGGELIKNLVTGKSVETLDIPSLPPQK